RSREGGPLVALHPDDTVSAAVAKMRKHGIEHIPVLENNKPVGSISENALFGKIIDSPEIKNKTVREVMKAPFPIVSNTTPIERLSAYINKDNGAVLTQNEIGQYHIVNKYDIIQSLAKG